MASSGRFVLPRITAPAARRRRTISASAVARAGRRRPVPWVVSSPATSTLSLTATGTPSSGRSLPGGAAPVGLVGLRQRPLAP